MKPYPFRTLNHFTVPWTKVAIIELYPVINRVKFRLTHYTDKKIQIKITTGLDLSCMQQWLPCRPNKKGSVSIINSKTLKLCHAGGAVKQQVDICHQEMSREST